MAKANTAATTTAKKAAAAPVAAAPVAVAATPAPLAAGQATLYTCHAFDPATKQGWPAKAQGGNTIRAFCYQVGLQLAAQYPQGFTKAQYAAAIAAAATNSNLDVVTRNNWGTPEKPSAKAREHANWFSHPDNAYLTLVAGTARQ